MFTRSFSHFCHECGQSVAKNVIDGPFWPMALQKQWAGLFINSLNFPQNCSSECNKERRGYEGKCTKKTHPWPVHFNEYLMWDITKIWNDNRSPNLRAWNSISIDLFRSLICSLIMIFDECFNVVIVPLNKICFIFPPICIISWWLCSLIAGCGLPRETCSKSAVQ